MKAKINRNREPIMLTSEDRFSFDCTQCGKCCRNREDVLLTGPDIYRVSQALDMKPNAFIEQYCEIYIGDTKENMGGKKPIYYWLGENGEITKKSYL